MPQEPSQSIDVNDPDSDDQLLRYSSVGLDFDRAELLAIDDEPDHFIREHDGDVVLIDSEGEQNQKIGRFSAIYVDVGGAMNAGESIFNVFDSTQRTLTFFEIHDDNLWFSEAALKAARADALFDPNLLILDRLEISPEHRGSGYGLIALAGLIHWLQPGAGLIAMKPFPLQFEAHAKDDAARLEELGNLKGGFASARAKLRRYYAQLGFKLVPRTDIMVRRVDQAPPRLARRDSDGG